MRARGQPSIRLRWGPPISIPGIKLQSQRVRGGLAGNLGQRSPVLPCYLPIPLQHSIRRKSTLAGLEWAGNDQGAKATSTSFGTPQRRLDSLWPADSKTGARGYLHEFTGTQPVRFLRSQKPVAVVRARTTHWVGERPGR